MTNLPVLEPDHAGWRSAAEVRAMAIAVQANLVQLKVADAKRRGVDPRRHDIAVPSPGHVSRFRETLINRHRIGSYSDLELGVRLHEVWGQYCLMQWLFSDEDGGRPLDVSGLHEGAAMRCGAALVVKQAEIHAMLWRLRFEQRAGQDADYAGSPRFDDDRSLARKIPLRVFGKDVADASDAELLLCACEHAGMLAALRWVIDPTRAWGDAELMHIADGPFDE